MEDYKEKYEQLEKFIKDLYPFMSDYCKKKTEGMIPELKESEEERIRKMLIEQMERWHECALENNVVQDIKDSAAAIDWLEKQKERGSLSKGEEYTLARIIEYLEDNDCPSKWRDLLHDVYILPYQKEQNLAWSEEDEKNYNIILNIIRDSDTSAQLANKLSDWLQSIEVRLKGE